MSGDLRDQIADIAAQAGWSRTTASDIDVYVYDAPRLPQPPIAFLFRPEGVYRPTARGGWVLDPDVSAYSVSFMFDMNLAFEWVEHAGNEASVIIPGVTHAQDQE